MDKFEANLCADAFKRQFETMDSFEHSLKRHWKEVIEYARPMFREAIEEYTFKNINEDETLSKEEKNKMLNDLNDLWID